MHKSRHLLFTVNKKMLNQSFLEQNVKFDIKKQQMYKLVGTPLVESTIFGLDPSL